MGAVITGLVAGTAYEAFVWIFYILNIAQVTPYQLGAYVLIRPGLDYTSFPAQALGAVQHYGNSSLLVFIGIMLARFFGYDYLLMKGLAFGAIAFFILYGGIAKLVIPVHILQPDFPTSVVIMLGNLVFGVTAAYTARYYFAKQKLL